MYVCVCVCVCMCVYVCMTLKCSLVQGIILEYTTSDMVLGLKGQRSRLGLELTAIRREFELYECLTFCTRIDDA